MTRVHQIHLPSRLVRDHEIDLGKEIWWEHRSVGTAPSGDRYVLSDLIYDYGTNGQRRAFAGNVLSRYDASGSVVTQVFIDRVGRSPLLPGYTPTSLSVLPDGSVLFSQKDNRAYRFDATLTSVTEAAAPGCPGRPRWAFRTRLTPSGRAVCLLGDNVVGVSDEPVGTALPSLTAVAAMNLDKASSSGGPEYCPPANVAGEGVPRVELAPHMRELLPGWSPASAWLHDVVPLDDDTFIVIVTCWEERAGNRRTASVCALVDATGRLRGRLDLTTHDDSAHHGVRDVVVDQRRQRVFHLDASGLYVFDETGRQVFRLSAGDDRYGMLTNLRLREFDPRGNLVMVHRVQHLLVTLPVPDDLADFPEAIADMVTTFRKTALAIYRRALMDNPERHRRPNWYWTADAPLATFDRSTVAITPM